MKGEKQGTSEGERKKRKMTNGKNGREREGVGGE